MLRTVAFVFLTAITAGAAEKVSFSTLLELSKKPDAPQFREALAATLAESAIEGGTAWMGESMAA